MNLLLIFLSCFIFLGLPLGFLLGKWLAYREVMRPKIPPNQPLQKFEGADESWRGKLKLWRHRIL